MARALMLTRLSLCLVLAVLAGCDSPAQRPASQPAPGYIPIAERLDAQSLEYMKGLFGDSQAIFTVEHAAAVRAFRLQPQELSTPTSLNEYGIAQGPIDVPGVLVAELRGVLLDPFTYAFDGAESCVPDYGARIQFQSGQDKVDVLLCFDCQQLLVFHNGRAVRGNEFRYGERRLVAVAKALFPRDMAIQSLNGNDPQTSEIVHAVFGGPEAIDAVEQAMTVRAFRVAFQDSSDEPESLEDYKIAAGPIDIPSPLAAKTRTILLDPLTYSPKEFSARDTNYRVRVQFQHHRERVDILLDLKCMQAMVFFNGNAIGRKKIHYGDRQLVAMADALFPDAKEAPSLE